MIRALCLCVFASPVFASHCADLTYNEISYSTCQVNVDRDQIALFLYNNNGQPYGQFANLIEDLSDQGTEVLFAMNAGMYHSDLRPVGHYIENSQEEIKENKSEKKVGRNEKCPCGSGKKFKHCHGNI